MKKKIMLRIEAYQSTGSLKQHPFSLPSAHLLWQVAVP
ncbi:hypothetical protein SLEP1_g5887 [Rubroshorea leprosula]|uniref:Uncharacterized protein n=1 Tax=Rubroshorea leprosula TaxID=152421 RepID=A0AAV5HTR6_9ROSI|nr:hypothetical protein SLEP1_g5887 [Rubroshorea leprosula]